MLKRLETLLYKGLVRMELLKRSIPLLLLVLLLLAAEACKKVRY